MATVEIVISLKLSDGVSPPPKRWMMQHLRTTRASGVLQMSRYDSATSPGGLQCQSPVWTESAGCSWYHE